LGWDVGNIFMTLRLFGPEEMGGVGDVLVKARAMTEKTGRNEEELIKEVTLSLGYSFVMLNILSPAELSYDWSTAQRAWTPTLL
jgi:hypothetical protein